MNWIEISLLVNGELAEAVAEVLSRHIPQGVAIEPALDEKQAPCFDRQWVRAYIPISPETPHIRHKIEQDLWHLSQIQPLPEPQFRELEDQDWTEAWKAHYRPLPIGRRLLVLPSWYEPKAGADRLPVWIDPGMAFGTGTHPTTRLCLEAMEQVLRPGSAVADLGCGSGILSIAALRLGARHVLALDIDPAAVQATRENARRNHIEKGLTIELGGLETLLTRHPQPQPGVDLLLANILAKTLIDLLERGLAMAIRPAGHAILSGILAEQAEAVNQAAEAAHLRLQEMLGQKDWRTFVYIKEKLPGQAEAA
ncbi:MAG TPA: 50S ribosomal protein L11 methyltransferase [Chloroflexi bacterium]|nr:50S ribosomal protein L11 methyltransferase [Chloroflexota bacterium]